MTSDLSLEKGNAQAEHREILPGDAPDVEVMGTTQLNESEEILLVPAPSADPRGMSTISAEIYGLV